MITCGKCKGRVFVDMVFSEYNHIETFCIRCGKRWMLNKESGWGKWLNEKIMASSI